MTIEIAMNIAVLLLLIIDAIFLNWKMKTLVDDINQLVDDVNRELKATHKRFKMLELEGVVNELDEMIEQALEPKKKKTRGRPKGSTNKK
tara:strand:+ start:5303 stop:5572 length:270 start_codon:yes stop_codon:yes gene_type:complete